MFQLHPEAQIMTIAYYNAGVWMTPAEAALALDGNAVGADYRPYCVLQS